jgi:PPOX class probable F420-dependent enzyme
MALAQGELGLLETDAAQRLLGGSLLARLAYIGRDGNPRAAPIWFHWTGSELVMASFAGAAKARALRERPDVAVTIDTDQFPYDVLLVRGAAEVTDVDGWVPEYLAAAQRYLGPEGAEQFTAQFDAAQVRMTRIAVRPTWVGLIDFKTRMPGVLGGVQG